MTGRAPAERSSATERSARPRGTRPTTTSGSPTSCRPATGCQRRARRASHPRFLRALGHGPQDHAHQDHGADQHDNGYTAENIDLDAVVEQLNASRETLGRIAELTDSQLDAIPPKDSFRFCDGQRTLEQVLAGLLKHQAHQVEALRTAA